jgi:hypothetical protein
VAGDWRLPNVRELHSLVDYGESSPAIPAGHPFSGVQSDEYWSSTSFAHFAVSAWYVALDFAFVFNAGKGYSFYVWPVRGGL